MQLTRAPDTNPSVQQRMMMTSQQSSALRRFASRYATFAAARIALVVGRWFVLLVSARHLSTTDFAALAAALSAVEILRAISDVGVDGFVYSRLGNSTQRLRVTVRSALVLRAAAALSVCFAGSAIYFAIFREVSLLPVFILIVTSMGQSTGFALLQKAAAFRAMSVLVAVTLAVSLMVDVSALILTPSLDLMVLLLVVPDLAAACATAVLASRFRSRFAFGFDNRRRGFLERIKPIAGKLFPSAVVGILVMAYSRLDVLVVLPMAGIAAQADYSAGFRLMEPFFLFFGIASLALLAELGGGKSADTHLLATKLVSVNRYLLLAALVAASLIFGLAASAAARQLFGFNPKASLLSGIFAITIPFRTINAVITAFLLRLGRFDTVMHACILNGFLTFCLAITLATPFGATGVACAALVGEVINTIYQRLCLKQQIKNTAPGTASQ